MKKFIWTRFSLYNNDPVWFDYRCGLFEAFTLPSMEQNSDEETYWLLVCNEKTPTILLEKLKNICNQSSMSKQIYILDYFSFDSVIQRNFERNSSFADLCNDFVKVNTKPDECVIIGHIDSDDTLCAGVIRKVELMAYERKDNFLADFPLGWRFWVHDAGLERYKHFHWSMSLFLVTDNREHHIRMTGHNGMHDWAQKNNYPVVIIDEDMPSWTYSHYPDSAERKIYALKGFGFDFVKPEKFLSIFDELPQMYQPNYENIAKFYSKYPNELVTGASVFIKNPLVKTLIGKSLQEQDKIKDLIMEQYDYNDREKVNTRKKILEYYQQGMTWLSAVQTFYGLELKSEDLFSTINTGRDYFNILCSIAYKGNYKILLSSKNLSNNGICTEYAYVAIIDDDIQSQVGTEVKIENPVSHSYSTKSFLVYSSCTPYEHQVSAINIGFVEYSMNLPGLNIVIYDNKRRCVVDSININITSSELEFVR